jgi:opacity protein-like surface antigen
MLRKIGVPLILVCALISSRQARAAEGADVQATATVQSSGTAPDAAMVSGAVDKTWQGFHAGVEALYDQGASNLDTQVTSNFEAVEPSNAAGINAIGDQHPEAGNIAGGLDAGYAYQMKHLVLGVDAEITGLDLNEESQGSGYVVDTDTYYYTVRQSLKTDMTIAVRPQIGFALGNFLVEGNVGVAMVHATYSEDYDDMWQGVSEETTDSRFLFAPVFGVGIHYHATKNWVAKLDLSYTDYGRENLPAGNYGDVYGPQYPAVADLQGTLGHSFDLTVENLTLGLDYQF